MMTDQTLRRVLEINTFLQLMVSFAKSKNEPRHEISKNVVCAASKASDQPAHTHSLIRALASRLNILWV